MASDPATSHRNPVPGVGVVCLRGPEVLLIRRGKEPRLGEWSLPGGRLEWGETAAACALRELREETGVEAELLGLVDVVDGLFRDEAGALQGHFLLVDYAARWLSGEPEPGDDAALAAFRPLDELDQLVAWSETRRVIRRAAELYGR
jgi:8-oxo-dGTP diphosphatase